MSDSDDDQQPRMRSQSVSSMMMALSTSPPPRDHTEAPQPIGENLLDALCIKYGGQPQGLLMYDDRIKTNIIGEFSVEEFLKEHQRSEPAAVRRQYTEVQDIDRVSYRSLYHTTRIGDRYIPIVARIIPGIVLPLLTGREFRDDHAESPAQRSSEYYG